MKAARRNKLPASKFAYKDRTFPIDTPGRARNALARASQSSKATYTHVAKRVRAVYGERIASVSRSRGTVSAPGYRKTRKGRRR